VPYRLHFLEGDTGVVLVHRHQERANHTPMQSVRPLEKLDAVNFGQPEVGRH
jgi:hypothetical protein